MDVRISRTALALSLAALLSGAADLRAAGQASIGEPFGVARISISLTPGSSDQLNLYSIREPDGRVLYPAFAKGRVGELVSEIIGPGTSNSSGRLNVSFLFKGQAPLQVTVNTPEPRTFRLLPAKRRPLQHRRMLGQWWRDYHASFRQQQRAGDYPPLVETYLTGMLSQRLGLRPPLLTRVGDRRQLQMPEPLELLSGVEQLRTAVLREKLRGPSTAEVADQPVPEEIEWTPPNVLLDEAASVEPIAAHVPAECLYLRFGSFANYQWFSKLLQEHGGDIGRMITLRGRNDRLNDRLQYQLALKESMLSDMFGGQVIADVAIIARDLYLREGAALGVLFQAKNNAGLTADLQRQRSAALLAERENGATLQTVDITGHQVSLLTTPDNRLRSFYARDGDFHLVSTSKTIVERFLEVSQDSGALSATAEFQHARQAMPLTRNDTIFAFFPTSFWAGLLSPQYQLELRRRLEAVTDLEVIELARLAATAEGQAANSISDLVQAGLVPAGFGQQADGSGPVERAGRFVDSLRGARGTFLPIADVELQGLTPTELSDYLEQSEVLQREWKQLDPLAVGIRRFALEKEGLERIVVDANISPLAEEKYGWVLSLLGPPSTHQVSPVPGDIVSLHAGVRGGHWRPDLPAHQLFLGIQDTEIPADFGSAGWLQTLQVIRQIPGYLGSWPKLGFLDLLPVELTRAPDVDGISRLPLGVWRWQGGDFSVLSFHRQVLEHAAANLQLQAASKPAQLRLMVGNLAASQLAGLINTLNYRRARQASQGNTRFLHSLSQQLGVPPAEALRVGERLLDTQLVCALGGEYELSSSDELPAWHSTEQPASHDGIPPAYRAPLLKWFRGLNADLTKTGEGMMLHLQLDMQRKSGGPKVQLPSFDLFGK